MTGKTVMKKMYIAGQWVDSPWMNPIRSPYSGELVEEVPAAPLECGTAGAEVREAPRMGSTSLGPSITAQLSGTSFLSYPVAEEVVVAVAE